MALTWAQRRRFIIIGTAVGVGIVLLAGVVFAIMYDVPSCMDGKQNQDETGVDCGGSCAYLCRADVQAPRVTLARTLPTASGRTDVIAYIENRNQNAEAASASYVVELFDGAGRSVATKEGRIDIPARSTVPLFIPGIVQGIYAGSRAFVSFEEDLKWRSMQGDLSEPSVRTVQIVPGERPRVIAVLENTGPKALYNRTVIVTVFDANDSVIAASQTIVRNINPQGTAEAVFTWNEPFPEGALRAEVRPVPVLP